MATTEEVADSHPGHRQLLQGGCGWWPERLSPHTKNAAIVTHREELSRHQKA